VVELVAKTACDGLLPITVGPFRLIEEPMVRLTSLAPYKGRQEALAKVLEASHGLVLPAANRSSGKSGARLLWFGRDQYLMMGSEPDPKLAREAALSDQSDAWACVRLEGEGAEEVLARLVPVDLRPEAFKRGHTVRTDLMHMMASITRMGPQGFMILVFRSMASTLVHDLKTAMESVAARR
jgi:sarcosine oxidase subunit gamma